MSTCHLLSSSYCHFLHPGNLWACIHLKLSSILWILWKTQDLWSPALWTTFAHSYLVGLRSDTIAFLQQALHSAIVP